MQSKEFYDDMKKIGVTEEQRKHIMQVLYNGLTVNVETKKFELKTENVKVQIAGPPGNALTTNVFRVRGMGRIDNYVTKLKIPTLDSANPDVFSLECTFYPFEFDDKTLAMIFDSTDKWFEE